MKGCGEKMTFIAKIKDDSGELWWCNSHGRRATHINRFGDHCCAPGQGGILLPCMAVNLTGLVEITEEPKKSHCAAPPRRNETKT